MYVEHTYARGNKKTLGSRRHHAEWKKIKARKEEREALKNATRKVCVCKRNQPFRFPET